MAGGGGTGCVFGAIPQRVRQQAPAFRQTTFLHGCLVLSAAGCNAFSLFPAPRDIQARELLLEKVDCCEARETGDLKAEPGITEGSFWEEQTGMSCLTRHVENGTGGFGL